MLRKTSKTAYLICALIVSSAAPISASRTPSQSSSYLSSGLSWWRNNGISNPVLAASIGVIGLLGSYLAYSAYSWYKSYSALKPTYANRNPGGSKEVPGLIVATKLTTDIDFHTLKLHIHDNYSAYESAKRNVENWEREKQAILTALGNQAKLIKNNDVNALSQLFDTIIRIYRYGTDDERTILDNILDDLITKIKTAQEFSSASSSSASGQIEDTLKALYTLKHDVPVQSVKLNHSGNRALTTTSGDRMYTWNSDDGKQLWEYGGTGSSISSAMFSYNDAFIVMAFSSKEICILDAYNGALLYKIHSDTYGPHAHTKNVTSAVFSHNDRLIASSSDDKTARIWNVRSGELLHVLNGHTREVKSAAFSHNDLFIVTASLDRTARIWDVSTGKQRYVLNEHTLGVTSAVFSPDDTLVATASNDRTARIWQASNGQLLHTLQHPYCVHSAVFSHNNRFIVTTLKNNATNNAARIWRASDGQLLHTLQHSANVNSAIFSHDDRLVLTASDDNVARIWDTNTGRLLYELRGHTAEVNSAMFNPNDTLIATASNDRTARIWQRRNRATTQNISSPSSASTSISADDPSFAEATEDRSSGSRSS